MEKGFEKKPTEGKKDKEYLEKLAVTENLEDMPIAVSEWVHHIMLPPQPKETKDINFGHVFKHEKNGVKTSAYRYSNEVEYPESLKELDLTIDEAIEQLRNLTHPVLQKNFLERKLHSYNGIIMGYGHHKETEIEIEIKLKKDLSEDVFGILKEEVEKSYGVQDLKFIFKKDHQGECEVDILKRVADRIVNEGFWSNNFIRSSRIPAAIELLEKVRDRGYIDLIRVVTISNGKYYINSSDGSEPPKEYRIAPGFKLWNGLGIIYAEGTTDYLTQFYGNNSPSVQVDRDAITDEILEDHLKNRKFPVPTNTRDLKDLIRPKSHQLVVGVQANINGIDFGSTLGKVFFGHDHECEILLRKDSPIDLTYIINNKRASLFDGGIGTIEFNDDSVNDKYHKDMNYLEKLNFYLQHYSDVKENAKYPNMKSSLMGSLSKLQIYKPKEPVIVYA